MKKPLFNEIERQVMRENKSFYASRMKLDIATKQFKKELMKTFVGRFIQKTACWLERLLT